jgi:hypothetical protein
MRKILPKESIEQEIQRKKILASLEKMETPFEIFLKKKKNASEIFAEERER